MHLCRILIMAWGSFRGGRQSANTLIGQEEQRGDGLIIMECLYDTVLQGGRSHLKMSLIVGC